MKITDDMLRAAIKAMEPDRIQGFLYGRATPDPFYVIRDVFKPPGPEQVIWRCLQSECTDDEWAIRCQMERLRSGLQAAVDLITQLPET